MTDKRQFLISRAHKRISRLVQFFFAGWGLIMLAALVAGALVTRQLIWTPISAINMSEIVNNQFRMENAFFSGHDKEGKPFQLRARSAVQEYGKPDIILLDSVSGTVTRVSDGKIITDDISGRTGRYNRAGRTVTLNGDVKVISSNGDKIYTDELVIQL